MFSSIINGNFQIFLDISKKIYKIDESVALFITRSIYYLKIIRKIQSTFIPIFSVQRSVTREKKTRKNNCESSERRQK